MPDEDFNPDKLRSVGRRGTQFDVEQSLGLIAEETANGLEGCFRQLHLITKDLRKVLKALFEGHEDEGGSKAAMTRLKELERRLKDLDEQLEANGMARRTRVKRATDMLQAFFMRVVLPTASALIALWLKQKFAK